MNLVLMTCDFKVFVFRKDRETMKIMFDNPLLEFTVENIILDSFVIE